MRSFAPTPRPSLVAPLLTDLQKRTIQSIVNVFETGSPSGDYARITVSSGDPGHLTYGRSQVTLAGGNLAFLVRNYCDSPGATRSLELRPYLPRLDARDLTLDSDQQLHALLREGANDEAMRRVQDEFFDRSFWDPALSAAEALAIESPLGIAVVYDSFIHGSWARLRDATLARAGLPTVASTAVDERAWIRAYITFRRDWLANHPNPLLRRAVYRMDTFIALAGSNNWTLALPLEAHGVTITERDFAPAHA